MKLDRMYESVRAEESFISIAIDVSFNAIEFA